jgi:glutamyl-tRNA synthetase
MTASHACTERQCLTTSLCILWQDTEISIDDAIRGKVTWNTDTLGDFVILRSNGQPVYNFCVAVDDALMAVSHVIRAEEHLPNSLRQASTRSLPSWPAADGG